MTIHRCPKWREHESEEFNILTEIIDKTFIVYDTFTKATEKRYRKKHPDSYHIDISFCPFCGVKLE
jgi:hypothetical protein